MANISAKKILIIQKRPHGDVLLNTSYLEALRQHFPDAVIDFFVLEPFHEILENNPFIDNVLVSPRKGSKKYLFKSLSLLVRIFFANYQLVIDQRGDGGTRTIVILSRAKYKLGWAGSGNAFFYNLKAQKGKCYAWVRTILMPIGIDVRTFKLHFHIKEQSIQKADEWLSANNIDTQELIIISPGAKLSFKAWNPYRYAALADAIVEKYGLKIAIIWAPNEEEDALKMKNAMKEKAFLLEKTTYNEAAAFVKKARLLICNDGGLNHISVAVGTPALALFGFTGAPKLWSPQGVFKHHYHLHNEDFAKDKRNKDDEGNTFGISPEDAFKKVESIFMELGIGQSSLAC